MANVNTQDFLDGLSVIAEDGQTYNLYGGSPTSFVSLDGAGLPIVRRITQRTPLGDGVQDRGWRLEPRMMTLQLFFKVDSQLEADRRRDRLAYIFGPTSDPLKLRATRQGGIVRQIDCYVDGMIDFAMSTRTGADQLIVIPLLAENPVWYDPTQEVTTQAFVAPCIFNYPFLGRTADDWPQIEITGPANAGVQIDHNIGTFIERIRLTGAIPAGETWRVDLRPGYKTVRRISDGASRMIYVEPTDLSSFATMRLVNDKMSKLLWPASINNNWTIFGAGLTGASSITIRTYKRYLNL